MVFSFQFLFLHTNLKKIVKKLWNILVLIIFVNFTALPCIAEVFNFDIPQTNMIVSEEENHSSTSLIVYEKTIPKTLNVHDFIKFFESNSYRKAFVLQDENIHLSPYLSIFSPPPEA